MYSIKEYSPLPVHKLREGAINLCGEYDVLYNSQKIGSANISENGLYYRIQASCCIAENEMSRMKILCGNEFLDLGLLIPEGDSFVLRKDLPRKHLTGGSIKFVVYSNADRITKFHANTPVSYLHLLEDSKLVIRSDEKCIIFNEKL